MLTTTHFITTYANSTLTVLFKIYSLKFLVTLSRKICFFPICQRKNLRYWNLFWTNVGINPTNRPSRRSLISSYLNKRIQTSRKLWFSNLVTMFNSKKHTELNLYTPVEQLLISWNFYVKDSPENHFLPYWNLSLWAAWMKERKNSKRSWNV